MIRDAIAVLRARRLFRKGRSTEAVAVLFRRFGPDKAPRIVADIAARRPIDLWDIRHA